MKGDALHPELEATYERRFAARSDYRQKVWALLVRRFFQRFVPSGATVLDLGCGWGEFINNVAAARKYGMDLNPASPQHLDRDVVFLHQDCSSRWTVNDSSLDVVFTSNFFEHLPDKAALQATLHEAFRALRRGGRLICLGPNIKCLPGAYWDFWDHHIPLTDASLREVLELTGFSIEYSRDRFLPYTMASGVAWPMPFISLYLQVPFAWRILGRQFLVVAVKP